MKNPTLGAGLDRCISNLSTRISMLEDQVAKLARRNQELRDAEKTERRVGVGVGVPRYAQNAEPSTEKTPSPRDPGANHGSSGVQAGTKTGAQSDQSGPQPGKAILGTSGAQEVSGPLDECMPALSLDVTSDGVWLVASPQQGGRQGALNLEAVIRRLADPGHFSVAEAAVLRAIQEMKERHALVSR